MAPFKVQKRSGRRQPLGVVSANTSYLPPKYSASVAKVNAQGVDYDDDGSVASSTVSRFSYRGIKEKLSKKKRGLISSIVASGNKIGSRRGGGESSLASTAALDRRFEEYDNAPCDALAYVDFETFVGRDDLPTCENDEDDESPAKGKSRIIAATLEDVDLEERAVSSPRVICDPPTSVISPSWSEYGSSMLETWGVLENAASPIDPPIHNVFNDGATDEIADTGSDSNNSENSKEGGVLNLTDSTNQHRGADRKSQSLSPLDEFESVELGKVPTSLAYCPPMDVSCKDLTYPTIATSEVVDTLSIEFERGHKKIDLTLDQEDVEMDDIESGRTRYIAMNDSATASSLIQCFAPLTQGFSLRSPAIIAMAFGSAVILLHVIGVISLK